METERLSAEVKLDLLVGERQIDLSHTGPDFVIAKQSHQCPPGTPAIVAITVNGVRREHAVVLCGPVVAGRKVHYTEPVRVIDGDAPVASERPVDGGEVVVISVKPGEPVKFNGVSVKVVRWRNGRAELRLEQEQCDGLGSSGQAGRGEVHRSAQAPGGGPVDLQLHAKGPMG